MTRPVGNADGKGTGGVAAATGRGGAPGVRTAAPVAGVGVGAGVACGTVSAGAPEPVHAASVASSEQPSRARRDVFTAAYRWECDDGRLLNLITLQTNFLLQDFKLGNDFEIFRSAGGALYVNEPRQVEQLHVAIEDGNGERVRQQI